MSIAAFTNALSRSIAKRLSRAIASNDKAEIRKLSKVLQDKQKLQDDVKKIQEKYQKGSDDFNINVDKIPISSNLHRYINKSNHKVLNLISRGDDYQVLFTSSKTKRSYIKKLSKRINQKITLIGEITNRAKEFQIFQNGKLLKPLNYEGYFHNF